MDMKPIKVEKVWLEKDVEKYLVNQLKRLGHRSYKFVSVNNRGVPDRLCIVGDVVWFVEVKRDKGRLSPLQKKWFLDNQAYPYKHVAYGREGVDEFLAILKEDPRAPSE